MIVTELYRGQGLGNQIWSLVVLRIVAEKNGYLWGTKKTNPFKGSTFLPNLDLGQEVFTGNSPEGGPPYELPIGISNYYRETNYSCVDENFWNNLPDNTKIDGCFQHLQYINDRKQDIIEWLKPSIDIKEYCADDICVINLRGKDYFFTSSWLPKEYYQNAINEMLKINSNMKFIVVTDDPDKAKEFIPNGTIVGIFDNNHPEVSSQISQEKTAIDYSIMYNAKYLILSASTFCFWAAWVNTHVKKVIAPKYWFDYNVSNGVWRNEDNIVEDWFYLDRNGNIFSGIDCIHDSIKAGS